MIYTRDGDDLTLESTNFGGGRIIASQGTNGAAYIPHYQICDHLGSVRTVFTCEDGALSVKAQNDYYPFGLPHSNSALVAASNTENRHLFNGKEAQTSGNLNLLDYGARMYNPVIGRWENMDKLSEKYLPISPYAYCANNPVKYIDPTGMSIETYYDLASIAGLLSWARMQSGEDNPEWPYESEIDAYPAHGQASDVTQEKTTKVTKAQVRRFIREYEEKERLYELWLRGYEVPEWALFGGEIPEDALYEARSNAISNAAMGIMPFVVMFKGITWFSQGAKAASGVAKEIKSVEGLIKGAGKLERLSGGVRQGFIEGNANAIFESITKGGTVLPSGAVKMPDGTIVRLYNATSTGASTIHINTSSQLYKIRITP